MMRALGGLLVAVFAAAGIWFAGMMASVPPSPAAGCSVLPWGPCPMVAP
jgi:hypothetical protein